MSGKVSVIIPIFNREKYIEECVESVLNQSYNNVEIILVDDGSTDNSSAICGRLAENEDKIKFFKTEHGGISATRNKGLSEATGEYVFFLDSDDIIHTSLFKSLVDGMVKYNAKIAATDVVLVNDNRWEIAIDKSQENVEGEICYRTFEETIDDTFCTRCPLSMIGGVMFRRDFVGDTKFKIDLYIGEDFLFIYDNLIKGADAVFLKQKWYFARWHGENISVKFDFDAFWTRFHRREIVWKSEENFGRTKYANVSKVDAFGVFVRSFKKKNTPEECAKINEVMKKYRKTLFPALSISKKISYLLLLYIPSSYGIIEKIRKLVKKHRCK